MFWQNLPPMASGGLSAMLQYCELDEPETFHYPFSVPNQSKSAGPNSSATAKQTHPPFEEALQKLEGIVEAMESDDLPLETLLARYEEGAKLVKICQEKLAEAELKIQQLEKTAAGEMKLKPVELSAE
jgi:exodeoxyribonuclease VII small subunit